MSGIDINPAASSIKTGASAFSNFLQNKSNQFSKGFDARPQISLPIKTPNMKLPAGILDSPLKQAGNFLRGAKNLIAEHINETAESFRHPIETLKNLAALPGLLSNTKTRNAFLNGVYDMEIAPLFDKERRMEGAGRLFANLLLLTPMAALPVGLKVRKLCEASRVAKAGNKVESIAKATEDLIDFTAKLRRHLRDDILSIKSRDPLIEIEPHYLIKRMEVAAADISAYREGAAELRAFTRAAPEDEWFKIAGENFAEALKLNKQRAKMETAVVPMFNNGRWALDQGMKETAAVWIGDAGANIGVADYGLYQRNLDIFNQLMEHVSPTKRVDYRIERESEILGVTPFLQANEKVIGETLNSRLNSLREYRKFFELDEAQINKIALAEDKYVKAIEEIQYGILGFKMSKAGVLTREGNASFEAALNLRKSIARFSASSAPAFESKIAELDIMKLDLHIGEHAFTPEFKISRDLGRYEAAINNTLGEVARLRATEGLPEDVLQALKNAEVSVLAARHRLKGNTQSYAVMHIDASVTHFETAKFLIAQHAKPVEVATTAIREETQRLLTNNYAYLDPPAGEGHPTAFIRQNAWQIRRDAQQAINLVELRSGSFTGTEAEELQRYINRIIHGIEIQQWGQVRLALRDIPQAIAHLMPASIDDVIM